MPCLLLGNLHDFIQDFVLQTQQIVIPEFPYAFNPSIIPFNDKILMCFRIIPYPKEPFTAWLGLIELGFDFEPLGPAQIIETRDPRASTPPRGEDARLFYVGENLYIAYSDNPYLRLTAGGYRMVVGEIVSQDESFLISNPTRFETFENENPLIREKNWVPFSYQNTLLFAYSISPHLILKDGNFFANSNPDLDWDWGILRGGTPALSLDSGEYLAFFHSVKRMATEHSHGKVMPHYFMGAYTFSSYPPFQITRISPEPIVGPGFYAPHTYKPYWGNNICIFPGGMIINDDHIFISYGRQDHEIWIAKLDKQKLLDSLIPVEKN